ncbi:hypothetical protein [Streptomyces lavendulae]|uniref:hypothetical protein n=1 Tax=Streptomyces lavendulae TaxID=1914 RepID=UPI0036E2B286
MLTVFRLASACCKAWWKVSVIDAMTAIVMTDWHGDVRLRAVLAVCPPVRQMSTGRGRRLFAE